jgi:LAGLIDADG DNA endonuclease family
VPSYLKGVIVGLILSEAHLRITKTSINARLEFGQSINNIVYFYLVFKLINIIMLPFLGILNLVTYQV